MNQDATTTNATTADATIGNSTANDSTDDSTDDKGSGESATVTLPDTVRTVLAVLIAGGGDTAANVAAHAGIGYSTVTTKLRTLETAGLAERFKADDGRTLWRATPTGRTATSPPPSDPPSRDAITTGGDSDVSAAAVTGDEDVASAPVEPDMPTSGDVDPAEPTDTPACDTPPGPAAHPQAPGGDDAGQTTGLADDQPGDSADGQPSPAQPAAPETPTTPADHAVGAADRSGPAEPGSTAGVGGRRRKGVLNGEVLAILQAQPQRKFTVGELCAAVDNRHRGETNVPAASRGAVANACYKLVAGGVAELAVAEPATFQIATT